MNESETRAEHIDPALAAAGWGVVEGSRIRREYAITLGRLEGFGRRGKPLTADYILEYRNTKLAVVEAKAWDEELTEGVAQAKNYAGKLAIRFTYATNGQGIYGIDMQEGTEGEIPQYPTPDELWKRTFAEQNAWRDRFATVPFEDRGGYFQGRYYQDIAIERVLESIGAGRDRILLTLATGTGKTFIAFQIAWKLFHSRWNLPDWKAGHEPTRRPRILFLADRNILADQAYNAFSAFPEDALVRIEPADIRKKGKVPKNGSLFFTIFQTFMASASSATGSSATGSSATGSSATGSSATGSSATGSSATGSSATGSSATGSSATGSSATRSSATGSSATGSSATGSPATGSRRAATGVPTSGSSEPRISDASAYMYLLECADGSFYTGSTVDLSRRLEQHQNGEGAKHTASRLPINLVYYETFDRIDEAFAREKQVQGWNRAKKVALITGNIAHLKALSRSKSVDASVPEVPEPVEGEPVEASVPELVEGEPVEASVPELVEASVPELVEGELVEGELVEGELVEGELVEGELVEGELVEGELVEGELVEGELVEGELVEGELVEGELVEGELVEGELVEGELVEGELVEGELVEGELVEGELVEGELVEGELVEGEPVEASVPELVEGYFGEYPADFFDFVVIDECHRGGANDESNWRGILEYFAPAVQLGLTATPKRKDNVDTYRYFGEPVFIYSLKDGINDGFLTPFKVKQISTTLDDYVYTPDDTVVEGEIEAGKRYEEGDFNKIIEIKERERHRVKLFLEQIDQREKTLVLCATQEHALAVRDLINLMKTSSDPNYCQRVTANDGTLGEQHLRAFQDNEKSIPTILTTSQKLSTGVDARNIRNIVLMRPINSIIEFKQIIGRGTRLYDGKDYFTIYDFVKAHQHFNDPEWDGEPLEPEPCPKCGQRPCECEKQQPKPCPNCGQRPCVCPKDPCAKCGKTPCECKKKAKVKLADGKERTIQHMMVTSFWHPDGTPMSAQQFLQMLFGQLPDFFQNEAELRAIWSVPGTRAKLLTGLADKGFGAEQMAEMQRIIDAEKSDLFDVLAYVAYALPTLTRQQRADKAKVEISSHFSAKQQAFFDFVLAHYVSVGVQELDQDKLTPLLRLKYNNSIADAVADLGKPEEIGQVFAGFQQYLYVGAA